MRESRLGFGGIPREALLFLYGDSERIRLGDAGRGIRWMFGCLTEDVLLDFDVAFRVGITSS